MEILSCVDLKTGLVGLKCNSVPNLGTKHHLGTLHEIVHAILERWHEGLLVNQVKVDFLICSNLDPDISPYEVYLASHVIELMILFPQSSFLIYFEK